MDPIQARMWANWPQNTCRLSDPRGRHTSKSGYKTLWGPTSAQIGYIKSESWGSPKSGCTTPSNITIECVRVVAFSLGGQGDVATTEGLLLSFRIVVPCLSWSLVPMRSKPGGQETGKYFQIVLGHLVKICLQPAP